MKILLVNCVYNEGSTGRIIKSLKDCLDKNNHDVMVCYARGKEIKQNNVIKLGSDFIFKTQALASRLTGLSYECSPFSTRRLKGIIKEFNPDIVNLHCINANTVNIPEILNYLKEQKIPVVITCHAEFLYTGGCGHALDCEKWKEECKNCPQFHKPGSQLSPSFFLDRTSNYWHKLSKAYKNNPKIVATGVSPWLVARIKSSPFFKDCKVFWTTNGVNTSVFYPRSVEDIRTILNINEKAKIYIHVTPDFFSSIKGGKYILKFAHRLLEDHPKDKIIIVGYTGDKSKLPSNTIALSHTRNQNQLAELYSLADVTLVTSKRETFSMVTAESLCCGTPVVGFKAGGPESICKHGSAYFVEPDDFEALYATALNTKKTHNIHSEYAKDFSESSMIRTYQDAYNYALKL